MQGCYFFLSHPIEFRRYEGSCAFCLKSVRAECTVEKAFMTNKIQLTHQLQSYCASQMYWLFDISENCIRARCLRVWGSLGWYLVWLCWGQGIDKELCYFVWCAVPKIYQSKQEGGLIFVTPRVVTSRLKYKLVVISST